MFALFLSVLNPWKYLITCLVLIQAKTHAIQMQWGCSGNAIKEKTRLVVGELSNLRLSDGHSLSFKGLKIFGVGL